MSTFTIIVPIFNEKDNLSRLESELVKFINETIAEKEKATTDDEIVSSGEPRVEAPPELAVADIDTEDWHVTGVAPLPPHDLPPHPDRLQ